MSSFLARYPLLSPMQQRLIEEGTSQRGKDTNIEEEGRVGGSVDSADESVPGGDPEADSIAVPKASLLKRHAARLVELSDSGSDNSNDKTIYDKITVAILTHFCDVLSLDQATIDEADTTKTKKRRLFDFVLGEVCQLYLSLTNISN